MSNRYHCYTLIIRSIALLITIAIIEEPLPAGRG